MLRRFIACAVVFALAAAGHGCDSSSGGNTSTGAAAGNRGLVIVEPAGTGPVQTFSFPVEVELNGDEVDPTTLVATLNGAPLHLSGGPQVFSTTMDPGPPLRDANVLEVRVAARSGGATVISRRSFQYLPPKARAHKITDRADLITGPLAHGKPGDYLLANTVARFIVQDVAQRDLYSVGTFGGNIIDAELVGRPGLDNFIEIQPAINIETVINAQTAEIVNDGEDGTAAVIRTCGPDDTLDFVNPSTVIEGAGLPFPASADDVDYDVDGCTDYVLEPGKDYVQMTTTIFNNEDVERGFYVGDWINASGEVDQFTTSGAGIGQLLTNSLGVMSFIGYHEATGVDYSHVTVPIAGLPPATRSTFFSTAGVDYVMHSASILQMLLGAPPTFNVPAQGSNSFTRFFGVGDGSGANAVAIENEVKGLASGTLRGCVTEGGRPAPAARVSVKQRGLASQFVTGADGCFAGPLRPGKYSVAAARRGSPYEGGGAEPILHPVTIVADTVIIQDIALPDTGHLQVRVVDENHAATPARISVVGFDPSPEVAIIIDGLTGKETTGFFNDITTDPVPFGLAWMEYAGADGTTEFDLEPGTYQVFVSRGTEYSAFNAPVTMTAGATAVVDAQIAHVIDTSGFVSSDFHVHGINSADSRVSHTDRAMQFAGEGVDNIIMTDHHSHTDLNPTIARLGLTNFVHATVGEEVTTWDYGHFNAYPLTIDPTRPSGGSTDWAGAAPPGRDFVQYGAFSLTPADLAELATTGKQSTPDTTIQINHIDSFFQPLQIDTSLVPPQSFISPHDKLRFRLDPSTDNLFHHFRALELWNGAGRGAQEEFLTHRIGIWMNHLNQGLITTAIADTDTHEFRNLNTAGARTWTASPTDAPSAIEPAIIARSAVAGRAVGGQGVYVQTRLLAADGSGNVADFTLGGSTMVTTANRDVDLEISVQAPIWAAYDRIEVYANAPTEATRSQLGTPVLFTGIPTRVLTAGADFPVSVVDVFPAIAGAQRLETKITLPFADLAEDTWFVVVVRGTDGVSPPMFPMIVPDLNRDSNHTLADLLDGNLNEGGVTALGFTNALYADVDGIPGFQAPRAPAS